VLAQFAFIVIALFAVLSLVADMGYVTLTRVQMQNATDSAALEGVRQRNNTVVGADPSHPDPEDPEHLKVDGFATDCVRRFVAGELVRSTFDDDLNPDNGDPRNFGAGPEIVLSGGDGTSVNAYQKIEPPEPVYAYKPRLQLNQSLNASHGDLVSGCFIDPETGRCTLSPVPNPSPGPDELPDYTRQDRFQVSSTTPHPQPVGYSYPFESCPSDEVLRTWSQTGSTHPYPWSGVGPLSGSEEDSAFLVRLRRTNNVQGLDDQDGVSSNRSTLPLIFARGTLVHKDDASAYNPRTDGLTVRATSIANAQPVRRVGVQTGDVDPVNSFCQRNGHGVVPFAIERSGLASTSATIGPDPDDPAGSPVILSGGRAIGRFVVASCSILRPTAADLIGSIGLRLPGKVAPPACNPNPVDPRNGNPVESSVANHFKGYVPVYDSIGASGTRRIIGFARIDLFWPNCQSDPLSIEIETHAQIVVVANASALITGLPIDLPREDIPTLMMANHNFSAQNPGALGLLAAALAR